MRFILGLFTGCFLTYYMLSNSIISGDRDKVHINIKKLRTIVKK